jgi:formylglycine-generating enzyme required for sulfatase activity
VGLFVPNPFGLHNVIGNVSEWCQDKFGSYNETPRDGSAFESSTNEMRSCRGSNCQNLRNQARSGGRFFRSPGEIWFPLGVRPAASLQ